MRTRLWEAQNSIETDERRTEDRTIRKRFMMMGSRRRRRAEGWNHKVGCTYYKYIIWEDLVVIIIIIMTANLTRLANACETQQCVIMRSAPFRLNHVDDYDIDRVIHTKSRLELRRISNTVTTNTSEYLIWTSDTTRIILLMRHYEQGIHIYTERLAHKKWEG